MRKLKTDEPDEEKLSSADENDGFMVRSLKQDLDESKIEIRQLSDELRRLRQKESSMDAENQILKSKLMQSNQNEAPQQYNSSVPKLDAPQKSGSHALDFNNTEEENVNPASLGTLVTGTFDDFQTGGNTDPSYDNYNQGYYDQNSGYNNGNGGYDNQ